MDIAAIEAATAECTTRGIRVLNAFLLADTETGHVDRLLEFMKPPTGATVLDAGCGIGEVALLMQQTRPDLKFKLLNISADQLAQCPSGMERIEGDFNNMPLEPGTVDIVMFNYSICHADEWLTAILEAQRVLKEGGVLFINDMSRNSGDNQMMWQLLQAGAQQPWQVLDWARQAGFVFDDGYFHTPVVNRLREVFESAELYDAMFYDVQPSTFRFVKKTISDPIESAFARHQKIAFQFSGGRDSTAALYKLRPYWPRMTIYHLDTGDQFPETMEVVRQVEQDVGPMVRIQSDVAAVRREFGLPSDLVPVDNTDIGQLVSGRLTRLQSRYECCARTLMLPMHARVVGDGNTLIIRGQRDDEYAKPPLRSGGRQDGLEVLYPIQDWTGDQVSTYLKENNLPIAPFYERGARRAPECMGCTAWWDEGRAKYLRSYHPEKYQDFQRNRKIIHIEIDRQFNMLYE